VSFRVRRNVNVKLEANPLPLSVLLLLIVTRITTPDTVNSVPFAVDELEMRQMKYLVDI